MVINRRVFVDLIKQIHVLCIQTHMQHVLRAERLYKALYISALIRIYKNYVLFFVIHTTHAVHLDARVRLHTENVQHR